MYIFLTESFYVHGFIGIGVVFCFIHAVIVFVFCFMHACYCVLSVTHFE